MSLQLSIPLMHKPVVQCINLILLLHGNKTIESDIEELLVISMIRLPRSRRVSLSIPRVETGFCV